MKQDLWLMPQHLTAWDESQRLAAGYSPILSVTASCPQCGRGPRPPDHYWLPGFMRAAPERPRQQLALLAV
jgi:hypothetical protein